MTVRRIDITALLPALTGNETILVPNQRIRDAILDCYISSAPAPVLYTPRIHAIDIWLREIWELSAHNGMLPFAEWQLLSSTQEHLIWTDVIEQSLSALPLLNPEETARSVNNSYRDLKQWLPSDPISRLAHFSGMPDVAAFTQWIKSYQQCCARNQVISLVDAIEKLLQSDSFWLNPVFSATRICLVNFFEPPPLYAQLFDRLATVATVQQISLHNSLHDLSHDLSHDSSRSPTLLRQVFSDQTAELNACAGWARELKINEPEAHIGIICCEDILAQSSLHQQLLSTLNTAPAQAGTDPDSVFNSSGSRQNLLETGIIHDAFLLLNLVNARQSSNDLSRLLQSPYLLAASTERAPRLQMELRMRRYFTATTTLADFSWPLQQPDRNTYAPQLAAALVNARTRQRQFPDRTSSRQWALHFTQWLADFGWPGNAISGADLATYAQWQDVLHTLASSSTLLGNLNLNGAISKLKALCRQQPLRTRFHPHNPLSIYSVAEAVGLQFDHAWLLGCSDQHWPPAAHPSPFIPYVLQREAQIPGSNSALQLQRAGKQFGILKASVTQQLIASHYCRKEELEYTASSFIRDWPEQPRSLPVSKSRLKSKSEPPKTKPKPVTLPPSMRWPGAAAQALPEVETIFDLPGLPLQAQESVSGGQSIISNQSSCPFRAFARHRLQCEPLERFATGLSMRDRGSALHAALEMLFAHIDSHAALLALGEQDRDVLLAQAAVHATDYLSRSHWELMTPRFRELEKQRIAALLRRFLELECSREQFQVLAREAAITWQYDRLQLRLKIDRIDTLDNASLALIDYKSGKRVASSQSWMEERPEDMQLPLYYVVAASAQPAGEAGSQQPAELSTEQQNVSALILAHVNAEKIAYSGLVADANVHTSLAPVSANVRINYDWPQLTAHWQQLVQQRALEFIDGAARVAPTNGRRTCEYCGLQALCRIQELDSGMADEEA